MAWGKALERWKRGKVADEAWSDVENWLQSDPVWKHEWVKIDWNGQGSHPVTIKVMCMSKVSTTSKFWSDDVFQVSTTKGGKLVKDWVVKELLRAYAQLEILIKAEDQDR